MLAGIVKKWNGEKGFGFLVQDGGGEDIFVHRSALISKLSLTPGDKVTFDKEDDGKGRGKFKAVSVELAEDASSGLFEDLLALDEGDGESIDAAEDFLWEEASGNGPLSSDLEPFITHSSLLCPFLVISEAELVQGMQAPSPAQFSRIVELVNAYITKCEEQEVVMKADFEGEMPGHGGVLTIAQLQVTSTLDSHTVAPRALPVQLSRTLGLLIDLRTEPCITLLRRIMESPRITKLLWGASGDFQCLLYQALPVALRTRPAAVIDIKCGFHSLGMAQMLTHLPPDRLVGLPNKEQIDFDSFHCMNRQALAPPISVHAAKYAMDDLQRIEIILRGKVPVGGSFLAAKDATDRMLQDLLADPCGLQALREELNRFQRRSGPGKTVKAVEIMRHMVSLRYRGVELDPAQEFAEAETLVRSHLDSAGVFIPDDLSFSP